MYRVIFEKYRQGFPDFPRQRRPLAGAIIKETRVDKGLRQIDFAKSVGMNESTLKSIENDHQLATTVENLEKCSRPLGLTVDDIILRGRERDPANYFVCKKTVPSNIPGIRKRKKAPPEWHQSPRIPFKNFDASPYSAPLTTQKDFFVCRIHLPPKRSVEKLKLDERHPVMGFVSAGYNVFIDTAGTKTPVTGNQGFVLDGSVPHSLINDDEDNSSVLYLVSRLTSRADSGKARHSNAEISSSVDVARGLERLRRYRSDRAGRLLSVKHLADLTDSLNHEQVAKLIRLKKGSSVIYWEKIEDLLSGTGVPMETFLKWCHGDKIQPVALATASTRALIDYSTYHAARIYSAMPANTGCDYFLGELLIEGKSAILKKGWERKDNAMIALYVEEGDLEITVGKCRSALPLSKGESIYFDGNLGYNLRNPAEARMKAFLTTFPAIQF